MKSVAFGLFINSNFFLRNVNQCNLILFVRYTLRLKDSSSVFIIIYYYLDNTFIYTICVVYSI